MDQEAQDLYDGDYNAAEDDALEIAYYEADAGYWWMSTKIALDSPTVSNVLLGSESHSDLHEVPVWDAIKPSCNLPN